MDLQAMDPNLTQPDRRVLELLLKDVQKSYKASPSDTSASQESQSQIDEQISILEALNDENNEKFQPTVFTSWDQEDLERLPRPLYQYILQPYVQWAKGVVRRPTDVVFLTHIILYLATSVPSAIILYNRFSLIHGFCHWIMQALYCGPFTLMLHNHIHNNGVLVKKYAWLDQTFPYLLEPLMGHTLHSYYYHHIKCHHVEGNGPDDLSSTLRYQRDDIIDFFEVLGSLHLACEVLFWEVGSYVGMYVMAKLNFWPTLFVLLIPFMQMRIGLMVGNWGQHALVDEIDPDSDYRSSIVLIDVASNRNCFNDGWHTAHHLNPLRHWRDQPLSYLKGKQNYDSGKALVFQNIDYIMMFIKLMQKDYEHLAGCLVPTGENIGKSKEELAAMLRTKTRKFTEEDIQKKFRSKKAS
ncbi:fatty acid desaturase [Botrytis cinerea]